MRPKITVQDCASGEIISREMTDEEFSMYELRCAAADTAAAQIQLKTDKERIADLEQKIEQLLKG